jgi:putative ABC transport system permease protein
MNDLRYGLRVLLKRPGFTLVAVVALGIGIGANAAIFSVVNALLLKPMPYSQPDRLVKVWPQGPQVSVSKIEFVEFRNQSRSFNDLAAYSGWTFTLTGTDEPAKIEGARATSTLFSLLGVNPELGRTFSPEEDQPGSHRVIIISHGLWQNRFGGSTDAVGRQITLDGESYAIIGVMPPDFAFPNNQADMWVPAVLDPGNSNDYTAGYLNLIARLKPDVTPAQAQADLSAIAQSIRPKLARASDRYGLEAAVISLYQETVGGIRQSLLILLGAVGLVLLVACANVANLQLARTTARQKEIAIRTALGASRLRVVRQLLTENILLALAGGAAGVLVAVWGLELLLAILPSDTPRLNEIGIDKTVLGFSLLISLVTGMLFGLAPALQTSKPDLNETLKESGRQTAGGSRARLRSLLVVSEVALALILVVGAGLLIKSFWRLQHIDPGFRPEGVLSLQLSPPSTAYAERPRRRAFYREVMERIESVAGVEAVGSIHLLPMGDSNWNPGLNIEGRPVAASEPLPEINWRAVTPNYFRAMGSPLVEGRFLADADNENSQPVALVNQTLARRFWPDQDATGKRIRSGFDGRDNWVTIVGVVGDIKQHGLGERTRPEMYRPYAQAPHPTSMYVMVRYSSDPAALLASIQSEVWSVDKNVPISDVRPLEEVISKSIVKPRSTMLMLAAFAGIALILGAVGIYGVVSYTVAERTREIGIRMAVGAQTSDVIRMVIGHGMKLTLTGVTIGLIGSYAVTRIMSGMLYGVSATDPYVFLAVALVLAAVALLACYIPARRATRVDPMIALRYE